jgi:hypothetical protein
MAGNVLAAVQEQELERGTARAAAAATSSKL